MELNVGIVGSRDFTNYNFLRDTLEQNPLIKRLHIKKIITGDAKGVDSLARQYALEKSIYCVAYQAIWAEHGFAAGPIRNQQIINDSDILVAFWDGNSKGTKNSIELAIKKKIPLVIIPI